MLYKRITVIFHAVLLRPVEHGLKTLLLIRAKGFHLPSSSFSKTITDFLPVEPAPEASPETRVPWFGLGGAESRITGMIPVIIASRVLLPGTGQDVFIPQVDDGYGRFLVLHFFSPSSFY